LSLLIINHKQNKIDEKVMMNKIVGVIFLLSCTLFKGTQGNEYQEESFLCHRFSLHCLPASALGCGAYLLQQGAELSTQIVVANSTQQVGYQIANGAGIVTTKATAVKAGISLSALANITGYACCCMGSVFCCIVHGHSLCHEYNERVVARQPR
jgi:hypothetical protein